MKKVSIASVLLILCSTSLWAQLARIKDKDGYVNVRSKPDASSSILEKALESDVFYCHDRKGDWYPVNMERKEKRITGYIHASRVTFIETLDPLPVKEEKTNTIVLQKDSIRVELSTKPFVKSAHTIQYHPTYKESVISIDHKPVWGEDGDLPTVAYRQIQIRMGTKQIELPDKALANLFEPTLFNTKVNYDKQLDQLYISSFNSDGAGGYTVVWIIKEGKYSHRTILTID
ncbi:SH3 domain-containing protein [Xanthocytophaga agilis]|uniref:SH3b domain-containing protein n=1 Tax=Xanthocytophaga agilis TaxID=3048010 RepID=A0AAE3UIM6_9BACT|nr:hypothetical protein [Xanthocytophaga agilis]MDJ1505576.1 hypothetical protein [Xanthocytophaga agilis]